MHDVAELVEESFDVQMLQLIFEHCHHVRNCFLVVFADIAAVHEATDKGTAWLLVLSPKIVEVELTHQFVRIFIMDPVAFDLLGPSITLHLRDCQTKELLINLNSCLDDMVDRKVIR